MTERNPHIDPERDPIDILAEEFAERCRRGENPSIERYIEKHPELGDEIRDLFPSIEMIEGVKRDSASDDTVITGQMGLGDVQHIKQFGDYRILREIGRGGMGIVYEAEQQSLGRRVALKVLPAGALSSPNQVQRFHREAQAAARLHHTNIVPVFGVGEQDGLHYYVMQFIEGRGLDQVISSLGRGDGQPDDAIATAYGTSRYWPMVADIGRQVADALQYAHSQGILHRDIKPANLLVEADGAVWIADFGLAKLAEEEGLTEPGDVVGTLRYMAPEQFKGEGDAPSDVYSLGLSLYELLTLRPAYDEEDRTRLFRQIMEREPERPRKLDSRIPSNLETIVLKAIAREPSRRYQTAGDLADDLTRYLSGQPILARKTSRVERLWLWSRRNPAVAGLSAVALTLLVATAVVGWVGYVRESRQLQRTQAENRRAEANVALAIEAFDEVFDQIALDRVDASSTVDPEAGATFQPMVSTRDAAILQNLIKFYGRFAEQNRGNSTLELETAKAHHRVAQIHNRLGQSEDAAAACRAALKAYAQATPSWRTQASLHEELGLALQMGGQHRDARQAYKDALSVLRGQATRSPCGADTKLAMARIHQKLGSVPGGGRDRPGSKRGRPKPRHAESSTQAALQLLNELVASDPKNTEYQHALALAHRNLAAAHFQRGRRGAAEDAAKKAIEILQRLREDCASPGRYDYDFVMTCTLGPSYTGTPRGKRERIPAVWEQRYVLALEAAKELAARHPDVPAYLAALSRAHLCMGGLHLSADREKEAEAEFRRSVEILGSLITQRLWASAYLHDYLQSAQALARLARRRGDAAQARTILGTHLDTIEDALGSGPRRRREWRLLAKQYEELAAVLGKLRDVAEHKKASQRAREIWEEQADRP